MSERDERRAELPKRVLALALMLGGVLLGLFALLSGPSAAAVSACEWRVGSAESYRCVISDDQKTLGIVAAAGLLVGGGLWADLRRKSLKRNARIGKGGAT
jgi:hypothetical protein